MNLDLAERSSILFLDKDIGGSGDEHDNNSKKSRYFFVCR